MEAKKDAVARLRRRPIRSTGRSIEVPHATYGIVTTGKAHLDLMEALRLLGLDEAECRRIGIDIYKVGMVWPLARRDALDFVADKREILVVEEKRGIIESQFKEYFYDYPGDKPHRMVGKRDENGRAADPVDRRIVAAAARADRRRAARRRVSRASALPQARRRWRPSRAAASRIAGATRTPYFCSGCPHNTSTKVPEGSKALAGIGCHVMATLDGSRDLVADPDGRRRRQLGGLVHIHRQGPHLPESRRRHLLPFRLDGDPPGDRRQGQHHLQDPLQRRRRDDRRPAGRWPDQRRGDRP